MFSSLSIAVFVFLFLIFLISAYFKKLDIKAGFLALVLGMLIYIYKGIIILVPILLFFILATMIDAIKKKKHKTRGIGNIIGNIGIALILIVIDSIFKVDLTILIYAAIAGAFADTISSELGMLSKQKPIDIITRQKVKIGANAGITSFGTLCGLIAAILIALTYLFFTQDTKGCLIIGFAGFMGTIIDSLLGKLENKGLLGNDTVNFLATTGSVLAAYLMLLL